MNTKDSYHHILQSLMLGKVAQIGLEIDMDKILYNKGGLVIELSQSPEKNIVNVSTSYTQKIYTKGDNFEIDNTDVVFGEQTDIHENSFEIHKELKETKKSALKCVNEIIKTFNVPKDGYENADELWNIKF